jgi:hypothetical protein
MITQYSSYTIPHEEFLAFMKSKFQLYHLSNVFFRDLQYGVMEFLQRRGFSVKYGASEAAANELIASLVEKNILKKLDGQTWLLNYPSFKLIPMKRMDIAMPTVMR